MIPCDLETNRIIRVNTIGWNQNEGPGKPLGSPESHSGSTCSMSQRCPWDRG